jgi:hypothetical protein
MALLCGAPAFATGVLVDDPDVVVKGITGLLADGKADEAIAAVGKYLASSPNSQANVQSLASALKVITKPGKALLEDEIWSAQFGTAVKDRIEYLNYPPSDSPNNEFVFLRYTFMRTPKGWQMTNMAVSAGSQFPPPGWNLAREAK